VPRSGLRAPTDRQIEKISRRAACLYIGLIDIHIVPAEGRKLLVSISNVFDLVPCQTGNRVVTIQIWLWLLPSFFASKIYMKILVLLPYDPILGLTRYSVKNITFLQRN
jgi:hypothetical protein